MRRLLIIPAVVIAALTWGAAGAQAKPLACGEFEFDGYKHPFSVVRLYGPLPCRYAVEVAAWVEEEGSPPRGWRCTSVDRCHNRWSGIKFDEVFPPPGGPCESQTLRVSEGVQTASEFFGKASCATDKQVAKEFIASPACAVNFRSERDYDCEVRTDSARCTGTIKTARESEIECVAGSTEIDFKLTD